MVSQLRDERSINKFSPRLICDLLQTYAFELNFFPGQDFAENVAEEILLRIKEF